MPRTTVGRVNASYTCRSPDRSDFDEDDLFEEELCELKESVEEARGARRADVLKILDEPKAIVAVEVLWQGRETEPTLQKIDPLWAWLFSHRKGLLQADGEGYYDRSGHILKVE